MIINVPIWYYGGTTDHVTSSSFSSAHSVPFSGMIDFITTQITNQYSTMYNE